MSEYKKNEPIEGYLIDPYNLKRELPRMIKIIRDNIAIAVQPRQYAVSSLSLEGDIMFLDTYGCSCCYALVLNDEKKIILAHLDTEITFLESMDLIMGEYGNPTKIHGTLLGGNNNPRSKILFENIIGYCKKMVVDCAHSFYFSPDNCIRNVAVDLRTGEVFEAIGGGRVYSGSPNPSFTSGKGGLIEKIGDKKL